MVWTEITRRHYRREGLRYESDTTDAEWFVMEPLLPEASALGRPRATDLRTVMNAILYIASTGCQWRQLPKDFPPYSTVQGYFYAWSRGGIFASLNYTLVMASREAVGCEDQMDPDRYFKPHEAAAYLRTSTSTLAKRRLYCDSPRFTRIGRAIRYAKRDLDDFMAANTVSSTSEEA